MSSPDQHRIRTSVIVPALDAWATLPDVLAALRPQVERGSCEVLLVESSGELSTSDLARRWPWVRVLALRGPALPGLARNIGAQAAHGDWLAFLDADCRPGRVWLKALEDAMTPDVDAVAGAVLNGTPRSAVGTAAYLLEFADWHPEASHRHGHAASCNLLLRRSTLEQLGGFVEDVFPGEDTILTVPLAAAGRLGFAPQARVEHLHHTSLRRFLTHQHRLGRSFAHVCARSDFPHRSLGRPLLAPIAGPFRLIALARRLITRPREALTATALLPLLLLGLAWWTAGLAGSGRGRRSPLGSHGEGSHSEGASDTAHDVQRVTAVGLESFRTPPATAASGAHRRNAPPDPLSPTPRRRG